MKQHEPGKIHVWTFDQQEVWVPEHGREVRIADMQEDHRKNTVLFLLRNAYRFRRVYDMHAYMEVLFSQHPDDELPDPPEFDYTTHDAQRWMLDRPLMRALLVWLLEEPVRKRNGVDPPCSGPGYAHGPHGDCPGYSTDRT